MLHRFFLTITIVTSSALMGCAETNTTPDRQEISTVMKIFPQGNVQINHETVIDAHDFQGGLISIQEKPSNSAIVTYKNGDQIDIDYGEIKVEFYEADSFLDSIESTGQTKVNFNLRKVTINSGSVTITTAGREELSKVTYTILFGEYRLTFKEGKIQFLLDKQKMDYTVLLGNANLASDENPSGISLQKGQTGTVPLK